LGLDPGNSQASEKLIKINAILKQIENDFKIAVRGDKNIMTGVMKQLRLLKKH
jgi:hypothetical protein